MTQILKKNIRLLERYSQDTAFTILYADPDVSDDIIDDSSSWYSSLDLNETQVLFVYGIGQGHYYSPLKEWLRSSDHFLVFIEDNPKILRRFCETEKASEILSHPRVRVYYWLDLGKLILDLSSLFSGLKIKFKHILNF